MLRTIITGAALALAAGSAPLAAQQAAPAGTRTTYVFEQNVMTHAADGSMQQKVVPAHLVIEQKGDSAIATWQIMHPERTAQPEQLRGTINGNKIELRSGPQSARLNGPNGEIQIRTFSNYILTVSGDAISGTINTDSEDGSVQIPSRQISGKKLNG